MQVSNPVADDPVCITVWRLFFQPDANNTLDTLYSKKVADFTMRWDRIVTFDDNVTFDDSV